MTYSVKHMILSFSYLLYYRKKKLCIAQSLSLCCEVYISNRFFHLKTRKQCLYNDDRIRSIKNPFSSKTLTRFQNLFAINGLRHPSNRTCKKIDFPSQMGRLFSLFIQRWHMTSLVIEGLLLYGHFLNQFLLSNEHEQSYISNTNSTFPSQFSQGKKTVDW